MKGFRFPSRLVVIGLAVAVFCAPLFPVFGQSLRIPARAGGRAEPLDLTKIVATAGPDGVLVEWRTGFEIDTVGFNVYRERNGRRQQINSSLIAGSVLTTGQGTPLNGGSSYSWFDPAGTLDSKYFVEDLSLSGQSHLHQVTAPVWNDALRGEGRGKLNQSTDGAGNGGQGETTAQPFAGGTATPEGTLADQWAIVAQPALKIGVRTNGWYHITQSQMVAAGFNTSADAANLRLFVNATEVAIRVSRTSGPLVSGDYVEFWGQGVNTTWTDTQMYYLVNDSQPGKRIAPISELKPDASPTPPPAPISSPTPNPVPSARPVTDGQRFWPGSLFQIPEGITYKPERPTVVEQNNNATADPAQLPGGDELSANNIASCSSCVKGEVPNSPPQATLEARILSPTVRERVSPGNSTSSNSNSKLETQNSKLPKARAVSVSSKLGTRNSKLRRARHRSKSRSARPRHNHAVMPVVTTAAPAFMISTERKDRTIYFSALLNGDADNFFGAVITPINVDPLSSCNHSSPPQMITVRNLETTAAVPAQLEVAMQGASQTMHQLTVLLNGVQLGTITFFGLDHMVQTFPIPLTSLVEGANNVQVVPQIVCPSGFDTTIVDYTRITYPHSLKADSNALQFNARTNQSMRVDGFTVPNIRVLELSDLAAVQEIKPIVESSGGGYAITVPEGGRGKARILVALPDNQFAQPASVSLNQPSTLNRSTANDPTNAADLLIISYKDFIPSLTTPMLPINTSLVAQRIAQGYATKVVDIEDIYDEFSFGQHGPQAIKAFISWATTASHWTTPPRYVLFVGGANLDSRNYANSTNPRFLDFVPTKLVDATFNETASDDWLTDFDDDGIADIPVGRLVVRSAADANLVVGKIVNFLPSHVPQNAMLVSDDPGTPPSWDFESSNDTVQGLLQPGGISSQKVYRRLAIKVLTGTVDSNSSSTSVTGTGTLFLTELNSGRFLTKPTGELIGIVSSITSNTSLTLSGTASSTYSGTFGKQDDATAHLNIMNGFNAGKAIVNYSGHGNIDVWTGANLFLSSDALALTNGDRLSFVVVMDCLNGYFQDPNVLSLSEALMRAPNGGAVAAFASSGLTTTFGQRQMEVKLYQTLYGLPPMPLGDAIKIAKASSDDIDVKRTWVYFGDPTLKIR